MKPLCIALAFIGITTLFGCGDARQVVPFHSIADIASKPLEWEGRTVRLKGKVTTLVAIPLVNVMYYEIEDATGRIFVETRRGLPAKGENLAIQGEVKNKVVLGDFSAGLVVVESGRI